jgi:hypothetical protein
VSTGESGLASNQAYQDGYTADPQQFQAPTERKPRMKQAVCCLSNSKGDPAPHGSVTPHKAGRAGAECSLGGQRSRTRPRPRTHWYKMFCCLIKISFVFGGPSPARTTVSGTSNSPLSHAGSNFGPNYCKVFFVGWQKSH